jgi:Cthe_2314-like HEPN
MSERLTFENSLDTPYLHFLMNEVHVIQENIPERQGYMLGANNYHLLTTKEKKISDIYKYVGNLIGTVEDLKLIYAFINRLPQKAYLEKHEISELDYIKYHYEVFIHKIHTICEIMKLVTNEVYNLNLAPKDCTWTNLIKHSKFNNSTCKKIIERYFDDFKSLIEDRNLNSHRGVFEDKKMDEISPYYFLYRMYKKQNMELDDEFKKIAPYWHIKYQIRKFKKEKLKEIAVYEQRIFKYLKSFLLSLEHH